uniref:Portal protein n=1 Tax=viral metagenome TaxID=1070528 RepID=A0A6H1ZFT9_9ZZZZ
MLNLERAIERLKELRDTYAGYRRWLDVFWSMGIIYDAGKQWGYVAPEYNEYRVRYLRNITDPQRSDVRVTINMISKDVRRLAAATSPEAISCRCKAASGSPADRIVADVGGRILERFIDRTRAIDVLRDKDIPRYVLGNMIVRRTLVAGGVSRPAGTDDEGAALSVRNFEPGWSVVFPWEVLRDPSATSLRPERDEDIFCHAKPRTVDWVRKHFGVKLTEVKTEYGELVQYANQIHNASGMGQGGRITDSKRPAVMVYECYYQDPEIERDWPLVLFAYCDHQHDRDKILPLGPGLTASPFFGLPFHMFNFDPQVQAPWSRGATHILMPTQDVFNIAATWKMRAMQAGIGKPMYEKGTVEDAAKQLNNRIDEPLVWERNVSYPQHSAPPSRLPGPTNTNIADDVLATVPGWMQNQLNLSDVQRGEAVKRGEAAEAYRIRLAQANETINATRFDDRRTIAALLYGTFADLTDNSRTRLDQLERMAGPDVPQEHLLAVLRRPSIESVSAVIVHPSTVQPATPVETKEEYVNMAISQFIEPERAQWEMMLRGAAVHTGMRGSYEKQNAENDAMIAGQDTRPSISDNHRYHRWAIEELVDSPQWLSLPPDARRRIETHWTYHYVAEVERAGVEAQIAQAQSTRSLPGAQRGLPSPPGRAAEAASGQTAGAVNPAVEAA